MSSWCEVATRMHVMIISHSSSMKVDEQQHPDIFAHLEYARTHGSESMCAESCARKVQVYCQVRSRMMHDTSACLQHCARSSLIPDRPALVYQKFALLAGLLYTRADLP